MLVVMARSDCYLRLLSYLDMSSIAAKERTTRLMRRGMRKATELLNTMHGSVAVFEGADEVVAWSRRMQWVRLAVRQREAARGKGAVACGLCHSLVRSDVGSMWSFGDGWHSGLGHGSESKEVVPRLIAPLEKVQVVAVAAGSWHSMALSAEGRVFTWGRDGDGRLGHGDEETQLQPKSVAALADKHMLSVAAGDTHTLALTASGTVLSWGNGDYGNLGHGDDASQLLPKPVAALAKASA